MTVKTATLTASKPAKPVKMSGEFLVKMFVNFYAILHIFSATHQNSSKVAANPAAKVAKPSGRNSESPKKSPKKPAPAGDSKPKHTEASPAAKVKPPGELSKSDSRKAMVLDVQKVVEPPVVEPVGATEKTEQPKSKACCCSFKAPYLAERAGFSGSVETVQCSETGASGSCRQETGHRDA